MAYSVVTIARTVGAGGEEIGRAVAERLAFRYADDEIIAAAAEKAGVSKEVVERAEHRPGLIARILDMMSGVPTEPQLYYGQALPAPVAETPHGYDEVIRDVIIGTAERGKVVIVAHGSGICLGGKPGVLRVLITAPADVRAARLAESAKVDLERATKAIATSDGERRDFFRRFYDVREELPTHYDLVVNTESFSVADATSLVVAATGASG